MPITKSNLIRLAAAAVLFGASGAALAFPCYLGFVDGSAGDPVANDGSDYECKDGPQGDSNDSAADLNAGAYFSQTAWVEIDKFDTTDSNPNGGDGTSGVLTVDTLVKNGPDDKGKYEFLEGNWSLSSNIWESYSAIAIVLKDGGKSNEADGCKKPKKDEPPPAAGEFEVFWSAYSVVPGDTSGDWSMPTFNLSHLTVYGVQCTGDECDPLPPDEIPMPAPLALIGLGGLILGWRGLRSRA